VQGRPVEVAVAVTGRVLVDWRRPGGRKPADVAYVGRPSRWGNPYPVEVHGRQQAVALFTVYATARAAAEPGWLDPLRGRRLACWCPPGQPCHADVLADLLDQDGTGR
jgi:hypothetical protein